jgi:hypothetical protein
LTTFGDFASLLQLGFGTGIGLGVFQAPIALRLHRLERAIENRLLLTSDSVSAKVVEENLQLSTLKIRIVASKTSVETRQGLPLVFVILGALANLACLIWSTLDSSAKLTGPETTGLIFVSVIWFVIAIGWMEWIAVDEIIPLEAEFRAISRSGQ